MSLHARISHLRKLITVEPLLGIFFLLLNNRNFIHYRFYYHFKEDKDIDDLERSIPIHLVKVVIPIILAFCFGSCSDEYKTRKPFLLLPIFGELVVLTGYAVCGFFKNHCPRFLAIFFYCLPSCFGGSSVLYMAAFAYIADNSNPKELLSRIGVLYMSECIGLLIHYIFSFYIFSWEDKWVLILSALGLSVVGNLYGIFWLKETARSFHIAPFMRNVFSWRHVSKTIDVPFRKYVGNNRLLLLMLLNIVFIHRVANYGFHFNLFFLSPVLGHVREYNIFPIIFSIGVLFLIPVVTKVLQFDNTKLLLLSFFCQMMSNLLIAIVTYKELLYLASLLGIFTVFSWLIPVSMVLTTASANDFGKISAMIATLDAAGIAMADIAVTDILKEPLNFVYVGAILFFVFLPAVVWMQFGMKINEGNQVEHDNIIS